MDFIAKLEFLMKEKGVKNLNVLAEESGIPYSTLRGFYIRGTDNIKSSTLNSLKRFFGCTLDYLVVDEITDRNYGLPVEEKNLVSLRDDEMDLIKAYNQLKDDKKTYIMGYIKALVDTQGE